MREAEDLRSLRVLEEIERDPNVSQRELASRAGIALAITNACVHTLVRKGFVKIRGESNRSITYHLTKKGLLHKARLAMEWTANTIDFYRQAQLQTKASLQALNDRGLGRLVLFGANEVAELVALLAPSVGTTLVAVVASAEPHLAEVAGRPVVELETLAGVDADAVLACIDPTPEERDDIPRVTGLPLYALDGTLLAEPPTEGRTRRA